MIRHVKQSDAQMLGEVYCSAWKNGYAGLMPDYFLDALTPKYSAPKPDHMQTDRWLVFESADKVTGTVTFGKGRDADSGELGEIYSLYVLPDLWRTGQGSALFYAAVEALKALGFAGVYLWALRDNYRAKAFYESLGMNPSGKERELEIAGAYLPEVQFQLIW